MKGLPARTSVLGDAGSHLIHLGIAHLGKRGFLAPTTEPHVLGTDVLGGSEGLLEGQAELRQEHAQFESVVTHWPVFPLVSSEEPSIRSGCVLRHARRARTPDQPQPAVLEG